MINVFFKALASSAMILSISACSTVDGLEPSDTGITIDVSNKSYNEVWKSSISAMSTNLAIVEMNKKAGVIKSEAPAGMATWGEVVGLFVTPVVPSADSYSIRIVSKKRSTYQITGQNWAPTIAARIQADLESE
ncbi:hypothetical protein M1M11_03155 [Pseudomonas azerbaijanoccidens]|uniref:hypothetical protein n=1 Tax=Pseudomonas azerbaijanoccidentalis TaxID=2842347 RepID=UPI00200A7C7A|nr:hypothetical protein [Pseudomonas azerbaijanoccidentalis]MCK8663876.1 hypothetical protein [Pseudomonas azerbaijanoccidentalis]